MTNNNFAHKTVLIFLLLSVAIFYGKFTGQILEDTTSEKGYNSYFQLSLALFSIVYVKSFGIKIFVPYFRIALTYLTLIFVLSFFRNNIIEDLRFFTSIVLTQTIILFLATILHKIRFKESLFILVSYFIVVLWLCLAVHLLFVGEINIAERNSLNRLGGLYFYGITGTLSGLVSVLSGIGFAIESGKTKKTIYMVFLLIGLVFTVFADLRNAIAASIICILYLFYKLSTRRAYMKFYLFFIVLILLFVSIYYIKNSEASKSTYEDINIREMIWDWTFEAIGQEPLIGYAKENIFKKNVQSMIFQEELSDPHSSILNLFLKFGIPASLLLLFFYFKISLYNYRNDKVFKGILIVIPLYWILATLTGGAFFIGNGYYGSYIFGLSIFGILLHPDLYKNRTVNLYERK